MRSEFWEKPGPRRLFPRGRGLIGFLLGPPGTGKTMAAQVIAAELKLDLYRVDIAVCLSKYIGETVKNLRQVFTAAARMNAVFLFDEADALFAKRTEVKDAHDRHANTDTNYLLQLLEDFDGIALLASNRKHNVDPAFMRRIRFILDFPRPGTEERRVIWQRLLDELAGQEAAEALRRPVEKVAEIVEMSGAQIKVALLSALFAAAQDGQPLGLPQLYRGINRELVKEGRAISPKDRERIERASLAPAAAQGGAA
jgi:SpoVK/Ycf46/Vps4 family AAA+-type ATPase